jgi:O-antigen/teichoic acid export membrane protein
VERGDCRLNPASCMVLRHAPILTTAAVLRSAAGLALAVLGIRVLGAGNYGSFSLVWSFCLAFVFMYTGVNTVMVARIVESRSSGNDSVWISAGLLLTLGVCGLLLMASLLLSVFVDPGNPLRIPLLFCPLLLALLLLTFFGCAILEGRGHIAAAAVIPLLSSLGLVAILAGFVFADSPTLGLSRFMKFALAAFGVEAAIAIGACAVAVRRVTFQSFRLSACASLATGGSGTQAANLAAFLLDPFTKSVLAGQLGTATVALFDLSMKIGWGFHAVFSAYSRLFLQIPASDQSYRISSLEQSARMTFVPAVLAAAIAICILPALLAGILQVSQPQLALAMALSIITCVLMSWAAPAYVSLIAFGDYGFIFRNQMILAVANVAVVSTVVPVMGLPGAFAGILVGTIINMLIIARRMQKHLPDFRGWMQLVRPMAPRLLVAVLVLAASLWGAWQELSLPVLSVPALAAVALLLREPLVAVAGSCVAKQVFRNA